MFDSRINGWSLRLFRDGVKYQFYDTINTDMKILEVLNTPEIRAEAVRKGGGKARPLIVAPLDTKHPIHQIKDILKKIKDRFIDGQVSNIKLIDQNPVIFHVVPADGEDLYKFTISFGPGTEHIQKALITGISKFMIGW